MIEGFYKIISSGSVLGEYKNMITANGLTAINKYMTGSIPDWAGSIAIGSLNNVSTSSATTQLDYEYLRSPVTLKAYTNDTGNRIILKTSVDPQAVFQAYELGLFPGVFINAAHRDNLQISDFSEQSSGSSNWVISGSPAPMSSSGPTPRINTETILLTAGQTASLAISNVFSTYGQNDFIDILFYCASALSSTASLTVSFADNSSSANVWSASGTISSGSISSGSFYTTRLPFNTPLDAFTYEVVTCSVTLAGSGKLNLDHMKIATGDTKTIEDVLTSRVTASGSTPLISKTYGQPMEIEYYIAVT
jgi:hypothetical protein